MKAKILCTLALAAVAFMSAAAEDKAVIIISTDGSQRQESIKDLDRIELGDKGVILKTTGGQTETFDYAAIDRILVNAEWDAVKEISAADEVAVWPVQTSGPVNISGLHEGQAVTVSNLKGATVISTQATEGLTTVNLSAQPAGIYIVTAANHSVKIIKK
ncbi:MAG: T9SS type A sorting domain-containing protein [Muribaculaceae bacterium]|nr:T9SS type A sorting domain-containing protein [Muribaculaceae bacterium]